VDYKEARTINSRSDAFKCYSGPYFHAIESEVYRNPFFIKHIPVAERGRYILRRVGDGGRLLYATDYTSFEAHFTPEIMRACELQLYKHMLRNVAGGRIIYHNIAVALSTRNRLNFADLRVDIRGCRMSGDMCTSLGNGFTNLMLMSYAAAKSGSILSGVVEGDDGLFGASRPIDVSWINKLGFVLKIDQCTDIAEARFCSMCVSPDTARVMKDPIKTVLNAGWTFSEARFSARARLELLAAKANSILCENFGVPIASALGRYLRRVTSGVRPRYSGMGGAMTHTEEAIDISESRIEASMTAFVDDRDRCLVERVYGIPIQSQLHIESYFDSCNVIQPIPARLLQGLAPNNSHIYALEHVFYA